MMSFYLHCARDTAAEREAEHYGTVGVKVERVGLPHVGEVGSDNKQQALMPIELTNTDQQQHINLGIVCPKQMEE